MNNRLKEIAFETITSETARLYYELLVASCEAREGGMSDADQMIIMNIAASRQLIEALDADIAKRGIGGMVSNGRQKYYQENKSIAQRRSEVADMRKNLAELKLTPNSRKASVAAIVSDDFDEF